MLTRCAPGARRNRQTRPPPVLPLVRHRQNPCFFFFSFLISRSIELATNDKRKMERLAKATLYNRGAQDVGYVCVPGARGHQTTTHRQGQLVSVAAQASARTTDKPAKGLFLPDAQQRWKTGRQSPTCAGHTQRTVTITYHGILTPIFYAIFKRRVHHVLDNSIATEVLLRPGMQRTGANFPPSTHAKQRRALSTYPVRHVVTIASVPRLFLSSSPGQERKQDETAPPLLRGHSHDFQPDGGGPASGTTDKLAGLSWRAAGTRSSTGRTAFPKKGPLLSGSNVGGFSHQLLFPPLLH